MKRLNLLVFFSFVLLQTVVAQGVDNANKKLSHDTIIFGVFDYDLAAQIMDETNRQREAEGVPPLKMTKLLVDVAMLRSAEAIPVLPHPYNYPHYRPNGERFVTILDPKDRCSRQSENLQWGSNDANRIVEGYMQSEGHRRNLLDTLVFTVGIGAFRWFNAQGELMQVTVNTQFFTDCKSDEDYRPSGVEKVQVHISSRPQTKTKLLRHTNYKVAPDTK